ncbi:MAG: HEAT repeat domain-containing protein [Cyanobacteria bacterium J083]|nr:MAG: HEAT repeat domain-containing protein [Cyanobacteria bacterium J083]
MHKDQLEKLANNLRSPALNERVQALNQLAKYSANLALPVLKDLMQEPDFVLRRLAVMGFANHLCPESLAILNRLLTQEKDPNVLAEIANSLFEFGETAFTPLQQLFYSNDNWLIRQTILSLFVDSEAHQILLELATFGIQDPVQTVKETAILALGKLLKSPYQEQALALLKSLAEDEDWRTRWRTATTLSISNHPQAKILLNKLQKDDHYRVTAAALEGNLN